MFSFIGLPALNIDTRGQGVDGRIYLPCADVRFSSGAWGSWGPGPVEAGVFVYESYVDEDGDCFASIFDAIYLYQQGAE